MKNKRACVVFPFFLLRIYSMEQPNNSLSGFSLFGISHTFFVFEKKKKLRQQIFICIRKFIRELIILLINIFQCHVVLKVVHNLF